MQPNEKVTVVTVVYNHVTQIGKTIENVLSQTYREIEYIVIDGKSTDGTLDVIARYESRIDLLVSEPDQGIFDAMNKGIDRATGDWIVFMNAGDYFCRADVLSRLFTGRNLTPYGVIYGETAYLTPDGAYQYDSVPFFQRKERFKGMGICHQSILVRTDLARRYRFDTRFRIAADYDMIRRLYHDHILFYHDDRPFAAIDTNGYSVRNKKRQKEEIARICEVELTPGLNCRIACRLFLFRLRCRFRETLGKHAPALLKWIRDHKPHTRKL